MMGSIGAEKTIGDSGGLEGTTPVMCHNLNLAGTEGPSTSTIVHYTASGPYLPGCSTPLHS